MYTQDRGGPYRSMVQLEVTGCIHCVEMDRRSDRASKDQERTDKRGKSRDSSARMKTGQRKSDQTGTWPSCMKKVTVERLCSSSPPGEDFLLFVALRLGRGTQPCNRSACFDLGDHGIPFVES